MWRESLRQALTTIVGATAMMARVCPRSAAGRGTKADPEALLVWAVAWANGVKPRRQAGSRDKVLPSEAPFCPRRMAPRGVPPALVFLPVHHLGPELGRGGPAGSAAGPAGSYGPHAHAPR